jgi:hypothetical protein
MLMEALQMLKFHLKKERLGFMASWVMGETEMSIDEPEVDLLSELVRETTMTPPIESRRILCKPSAVTRIEAEVGLWLDKVLVN